MTSGYEIPSVARVPTLPELAAQTRDRFVDGARDRVHWVARHGVPRLGIAAAARRGDLQAQLISSASYDSSRLVEVVDQMRVGGPVYRSPLGAVVTSHAGVRAVLTGDDFHVFRPEAPGVIGEVAVSTRRRDALHPLEKPSLLATDPPDHTRYRRLVTGVFTMRAVERLRARTEQIAHQLLDQIEADAGRTVDLVEAYCAPLPVTVIAEILGVDPADHASVLAYGTAAAPSLDMGLTWRQHRDVDRGLRAFDAWLQQHLERLRREPGDNLMSELVAAHDEHGGLDDRELRATAGLVLAAGFETTVNLLGNAVALLDTHRTQRDRLVAGTDVWGGSWANAVEEVLRYDPPVLMTGRRAVRDTEVEGVRIPAGDTVATLLWAANRDADVFADPHTFDVARPNARDHIAFSAGRHHCLGAQLARMEGEVGLRVLHERFPDLRVVPGARRRSTRILRGFESLPVVLRR